MHLKRPAGPHVLVALTLLFALGSCGGDGAEDRVEPRTAPSSSTPTSEPTSPPSNDPTAEPEPTAEPTPGLVYYAGSRARTAELLLFAEQVQARGKGALLTAVRAATAGTPLDPDYETLWPGISVDEVKLFWDGDEGFYQVRLEAGADTSRPAGMSMRQAHLAIQQVVWTLHSVGDEEAPVEFVVGRSADPVTDLLGVPATGPYDAYLAADYTGVLSKVNILTAQVGEGTVEISGVAESFEATVGVRVLGPDGEVVHDYSTQAQECCGRLFPWTYTLDAADWSSGDYTIEARTDDPVGIAQGSDGPEIDTKKITIS